MSRMSNEIRRLLSVILLALAIPPWIGALIATPYMMSVNWPGMPLKRPRVAHIVFGFEGVSVLLLLVACILIFQVRANRQSWQGKVFAIGVVLMMITAAARSAYVWFLVLA